jgi:hypothetical protein
MNTPRAASQAASNSIFVGSALLMVLSVSLFTGSHGFVRIIGKLIHPFEIAFFIKPFFSLSFIYRGCYALVLDPCGRVSFRSIWSVPFLMLGALRPSISLSP